MRVTDRVVCTVCGENRPRVRGLHPPRNICRKCLTEQGYAPTRRDRVSFGEATELRSLYGARPMLMGPPTLWR